MVKENLANSTTLKQKFISNNLTFVSQSTIDQAYSLVNSINLDKLNSKLENYYGWDKEEVKNLCKFYREWLVLHICYPDISLSPNAKLDEYWHMHILDTYAYTQDCLWLFGEYLHHYPYFGLEGDANKLEESFNITNELYLHHFKHKLSSKLNPCKSTNCR